MRTSTNPVFRQRGPVAQGQQQPPTYGTARGGTTMTYGQPQPGGGNPFGQQQAPYAQQPMSAEQLQQQYNQQSAGPVQTGRMTMDDVIAKTAMMIGLVVVAGAFSWAFVPAGVAYLAMFVAFGIAMFVIFKRKVNPALVMSYAIVEGVFLGGISHVFNDRWPGIVVQAVLGTAMVFGGMLVAYKSGWVRVTSRYARIGMAIALGFLGLILVNLVVSLFAGTDALGLNTGPLAIVMGVVGVLLGAFFLSLDFHEAEQLVAAGVPEKESWRSAFGLTLSLVWIYIQMLQLLSALRD